MGDDDRFDGLLLSLAQQKQGIDPMLDTIFSFLRRKTDFFTGADVSRARQTVLGAFDRQAAIAGAEGATGGKQRDEAREREARERAEIKRRQEADELEARMAAAAAAAAEVPRVEELPDAPSGEAAAAAAAAASTSAAAGDSASGKDDNDGGEAGEGEEEEEDTTPPPLGNGGAAANYVWTQTLQEVTVTVPVPAGTRGRQVDVIMRPTTLRVGLKGQEPLIDGALFKRIIVDDSVWTIEDNRLLVLTLQKQNQMEWWKSTIQGDPEIDTSKVQPENSRLGDLDRETRQVVEKMQFDQMRKAQGLPTSDEMQKQEVLDKFMKQHPEMDFSQAKIN